MVRDDMESGIVTSYKNKGIIIPELISLPFFLRSSNICLKLFFRQIFLKSIYFSSCKIPENQESASLMVTSKVMSYTDYTMTPCIQKVFIATYINFVYDRQCIIIMLIHIYVVYDSRRTLFDFWEQM